MEKIVLFHRFFNAIKVYMLNILFEVSHVHLFFIKEDNLGNLFLDHTFVAKPIIVFYMPKSLMGSVTDIIYNTVIISNLNGEYIFELICRSNKYYNNCNSITSTMM